MSRPTVKRFVWIAAGTAALAVSAGLAAPKGRATTGVTCGTDRRWAVKTLADRPQLLFPTRLATVKWLVTRKPPADRTSTRMPFEFRVFTVVARVTTVQQEGDADYHLTLREHGWPMIAESPAPECTAGAKGYYRRLMARVHRVARVCARARITGVAFFDTEHGQPGVAPNGIELHPLLGFQCL
jgi:hypothetical protein